MKPRYASGIDQTEKLLRPCFFQYLDNLGKVLAFGVRQGAGSVFVRQINIRAGVNQEAHNLRMLLSPVAQYDRLK
jgi:hypothetical protein